MFKKTFLSLLIFLLNITSIYADIQISSMENLNEHANISDGFHSLSPNKFTLLSDIEVASEESYGLHLKSGTYLSIHSESGSLNTSIYKQSGGVISSKGANNSMLHGINTEKMHIDGGIAIFEGGSLAKGGHIENEFLQSGGTVFALGVNNYGLATMGTFIQQKGLLVASSGSGETSYGIYIHKGATFGDKLSLKNSDTHAIYVNNEEGNLRFEAKSTLFVEASGEKKTSGRIYVNQNNTVISKGASVKIILKDDSHMLGSGESYTNSFIEHNEGEINGTFKLLNKPTLTINYYINKTEKSYDFNVKRVNTAADVLRGNLSINEQNFFNGMDSLYGQSLDNQLLKTFIHRLDAIENYDAFYSISKNFLNSLAIYDTILFEHLQFLSDMGKNTSMGYYDEFRFYNTPAFYVTALAGNTINQKRSEGHPEATSYATGLMASFGASNKSNNILLSSYISKGKMDFKRGDAETEQFGIYLIADHKIAESIYILMDLGSSYTNIKQKRITFDQTLKSKTHACSFTGGLSLEYNFNFKWLILSPSIGTTYAYMNIDPFTDGSSDLALHVTPEEKHSLKADTALLAIVPLNKNIILRFMAGYHYEFFNKQSIYKNEFVTASDFKFNTEGPKKTPHSANVGLGISYSTSRLINIAIRYQASFADMQVTQEGAVDLKFNF